MIDDDPEIEILDDPPSGYTEAQWDDLTCCACYGCDECEHICHRTLEEQHHKIRHHEEARAAALKGPGCYQLSDGKWVTILRGPGDPDYPKGDGLDTAPSKIRKLQIPFDLPHFDPYEDE